MGQVHKWTAVFYAKKLYVLSVLIRKSHCFFRKNTGFPCLILNKDEHGQNTELFSLEYGSQYIDSHHLGKQRIRTFPFLSVSL